MADAIEILVEIVAQEADTSVTPALSKVVLRGSSRGTVLSSGESYADFLILDARILQRANDFGRLGIDQESWLDVSYPSIAALDETYNLGGKTVLVRVGQGTDAASYVKPSTGNDRARCFVWRGAIPLDWSPNPNQDRSMCRLSLAPPLAYKSFPVLPDKYDEDAYSTAPTQSKNAPIPILFGQDPGRAPGTPCFPMLCIRDPSLLGSNEADFAVGNLKMGGAYFEDVYESPYNTNGVDGTDSNSYPGEFRGASVGSRAISENVHLWYVGDGIANDCIQPAPPNLTEGNALRAAGDVIYWLLFHRGDQPATEIADGWLYGTNAPFQIATVNPSKDDPGVYFFVNSAVELAEVLAEIATNFLVVLRQVDGTRQSRGMTPVWTVADRMVKKPSTATLAPLPLDPGWLITDLEGNPDIRQLGPHPLYANSAVLHFSSYPAISNYPSRPFFNDAKFENSDDQDERGVVEKNFNFRWNTRPDELIADLSEGEGLCSERWGRWTDEDPVSLFGFSLRLPMGDVLVGDMLDFGRQADGTDSKRRYYFIEETELDWKSRRLNCLASRFKDRAPIIKKRVDKYLLNFPPSLISRTRTKYPPPFPVNFEHNPPWVNYFQRHSSGYPIGNFNGSARAVLIKSTIGTDFSGLRIRWSGRSTSNQQGYKLRLWMSATAPPNVQSPYSGWEDLSGATKIYDPHSVWQYTLDATFDYTFTPAQIAILPGKYFWMTCEYSPSTPNNAVYGSWRQLGLEMDFEFTTSEP